MGGLPPSRRFPVLWELDARTTVRRFGDDATLDDLTGAVLDALVPAEADWLYLLGVWQTGAAGRSVSRLHPDIRRACAEALDEATDEDICGSCFAVTGYRVHERLGGDAALARFRHRLADRGVRLMLDFVPNHTAPDHPWVIDHPDHYVAGTDDDLANAPADWIRLETGQGERVLAYGRDPYFAGWPDTLQLDYSSAAVGAAMSDALADAAGRCDGLRCDMAMLLLPDIFERTWGRTMEPFWPEALERVHADRPDFMFMAEVYWDREHDLQQQGFDATYDKRLYDRLVGGDHLGVSGHLHADADYQARSARFLENHDEPRAATTLGVGPRHRAAAVITYLTPGVRFFQDGQRQARRIHAPVHLCRAPREPDRDDVAGFYDALSKVLDDPVVHDGAWRLLEPRQEWDGNPSHEHLIAFTWTTSDGTLAYVVVVNLAGTHSQGYLPLQHAELAGRTVSLVDRLGEARFELNSDDVTRNGWYVDVEPWAHHVFAVERSPQLS